MAFLQDEKAQNDDGRQVAWPDRKDNKLLGKEVSRVDGIEKSSGSAKYSADINTKGTLIAKVLTFKGGHAKIVRLNVEAAKKIPGVHAVHLFKDVDAECRYDGDLVAAVAAERAEIADDAIRAIEVQYEKLPHWVDEDDLAGAEAFNNDQVEQVLAKYPENVRKAIDLPASKVDPAIKEEVAEAKKAVNDARIIKSLGDNTKGQVEDALKDAKAVQKGYYGIHTITHMCLEPHGSHCEWKKDDDLEVHLSTQNVSGTAGQFAGPLGVGESNVTIICDYIGGGFGSKFAADEWGLAAAKLAKDAGRPVKLLLDRATEMKAAGNRPSGFAKVTIAADADGKITAWDSEHWGTGGIGGGTIALNQMPYVFDFENRNRRATGITTNAGPQRAWRAPNHPQLCAITCTAIDDLAAKLEMDSYDLFLKNLPQASNGKSDVYAEEMKIGAKLIDWKAKWHPHGKGQGKGPVKTGLGMALHQWGGRAHAGTCTVKVNPDGTVESISGSQDIGTGTRTGIAITLAETFGIPLSQVKVTIGSSKYPKSGPSGGSTTIGGVTGPNRRAGLEALWKVFDLVAEKYDVKADTLAARDGKIFSGEKEVCTWKQAAGLSGPRGIEVLGEGPKDDGLTDQGVGGIQMAEVSVDTETGRVRINKFVAVQDCGLIVDLKTAKSQVYGAMIMGIAYALMEERIMDNRTGRFINADLENYKLARIGDIGELVVEMYQPDSEYQRGVIGLGEPPVISPGAAISNAVANALGVRVPVLPLTPQRVLEALKGAQA